MDTRDAILTLRLREQLALEEHLSAVIDRQIQWIHEPEYLEARNVLDKAARALEEHCQPLNAALDRIEQDLLFNDDTRMNGLGGEKAVVVDSKVGRKQLSAILRESYSALNDVTMSNTLLHTVALALKCDEVANLAIKHLENLAPLVVQIGEIVPEVTALELRAQSPTVDLGVAEVALENSRRAWRKAS
jgi:hypothetical protein